MNKLRELIGRFIYYQSLGEIWLVRDVFPLDNYDARILIIREDGVLQGWTFHREQLTHLLEKNLPWNEIHVLVGRVTGR